MRHLDPKNDLVFKKVFGEHADLLISFLNSILPLENGRHIIEIEYLPAELVPDIPLIIKNSIVDVRCKDSTGRQFIVEMQMLWTDSFKSRVLFNASKAYIKQLHKGIEYQGLQPVYALSLVNANFEFDIKSWFHHYKMVHIEDNSKVIDGLQLIFIELPKFKATKFNERNLSVLWLRYFVELENMTEMISEDLLSNPEIKKAIELTKESYYSAAELETYDKYWDSISTEKTLIVDAEAKGLAAGLEQGKAVGVEEGKAIGVEEGKAIGVEEGEMKNKILVINNGFEVGLEIGLLAQLTQLSVDDVQAILKEQGKV
jgi:predicted transposase/invertase (TIGR01784 family)